ncbi:hypothetical protein EB118_19345 [bacterium]|nr:hypothetical protein [bacterium]
MRKGIGDKVIQWIGVLFTLLGLVYTGVKDYQKGDIKIPQIQKPLTVQKYPIQYCLMAYDPNIDKVFYLHENGQWYDFAPEQRRYATTPQVRQQTQTQGQKALGDTYGSQGTQGYCYGQSPQATAYTQRY